MTAAEPTTVSAVELRTPPPRADDVVMHWIARTARRARYSVLAVTSISTLATLLMGVSLATTEPDKVTRFVIAFVPWIVLALPFTLLMLYVARRYVRHIKLLVRDGVAQLATVVQRSYSSAGLFAVHASWIEDGRVVVARIELWGSREIDETTTQITVLAIPGARRVVAVIGREMLAAGRVKRRVRRIPAARLIGGA